LSLTTIEAASTFDDLIEFVRYPLSCQRRIDY